jgi:hypothetical protein
VAFLVPDLASTERMLAATTVSQVMSLKMFIVDNNNKNFNCQLVGVYILTMVLTRCVDKSLNLIF